MQDTKQLTIMNGKTLLSLDVEPPKFIISGLLPVGLHMLAGSPKIGKSWLALWLCNQISKGEKVWEFETLQCGALYLSLEDTMERLHFRLSRITEDGSEQSYFATNADSLSGSLMIQLETFLRDYPDTGIIVIDTFQKIRDGINDKNAYASDYEEINKIKAVADKYKIAVLLVHHLRKMPDSDPFNMVSGSTGIIGAVDSLYILEKDSRTDNKAKLHVTGRDVEDMQIQLEFDRNDSVWRFVSFLDHAEKKEDKISPTLIAYMNGHKEFMGTATELLKGLREYDDSLDLKPNSLTRTINEQALTLEKNHGIKAAFSRKNNARLIHLSMHCDGDSEYICGGIEKEPSPIGVGLTKGGHGQDEKV